MHELRRGELANLRAIPHTPYFGSVDATPLWLLAVAELTMWTGDLDGFDFRRDAVDAALAWLDVYGDFDGDGFVEYERRSRAGLRNQGWRDAGDAVLHADGSQAEGPHRPRRDPGLRVLRQAPPRRPLRAARRRGAGRAPRAGGRRAQAALQRALLDGGRGLLRDGARRREEAGRSRSARRSATRCGRASSPTSTWPRWSSASWRPTCSPAGACARSART